MTSPTSTYAAWRRLSGRPGGTRPFSAAAMGMLMEATVPRSHRWIPKAVTVEYLEKAATSLRARAQLDPPDFTQITDGVELVVPVTATDRHGTEVVRADITTWARRTLRLGWGLLVGSWRPSGSNLEAMENDRSRSDRMSRGAGQVRRGLLPEAAGAESALVASSLRSALAFSPRRRRHRSLGTAANRPDELTSGTCLPLAWSRPALQ